MIMTPEEYLKEASRRFSPRMESQPTADDIAIKALELCIRDHDKFVNEQLTRVNSLIEKIATLQKTIEWINSQIQSSSPPTRNPSSESIH